MRMGSTCHSRKLFCREHHELFGKNLGFHVAVHDSLASCSHDEAITREENHIRASERQHIVGGVAIHDWKVGKTNENPA